MNISLAIEKLQEINALDERGRYGRLAQEAIEALTPTPIPWDSYHNRSYEPVETLARTIYDEFEYDGPPGTKKPTWALGGNSTRQDAARIIARERLHQTAGAA